MAHFISPGARGRVADYPAACIARAAYPDVRAFTISHAPAGPGNDGELTIHHGVGVGRGGKVWFGEPGGAGKARFSRQTLNKKHSNRGYSSIKVGCRPADAWIWILLRSATMKTPATPDDEFTRLRTLRALRVLDSEPEERFDRLTRLAKRMFGVPIALVSLVDENRQWFKSCLGLPVRQTPRDISFCGHAILGDEIFVIENALEDERFADNPLVTGEPHIRFYAGCPLAAPNGTKLGTLCIIDREPRTLDADDLATFKDLARMAEDELAAISLATMDELTCLSNRRGFEVLAKHTLDLCRRMQRSASLLFFDLDRFKQINDRFGHAEGDRALQAFADVLKRVCRESDLIARISGDEFAVLATASSPVEIERMLRRFQAAVDDFNAQNRLEYRLGFSAGSVDYDPERHASIGDILNEADTLMYAQKRARA